MNLKRLEPTAEQIAMHQELRRVIVRHGETLSPVEMVALVAQCLGAMLALFNSSLTTAQLMEFVLKNIEAGNADFVACIESGKDETAEQGAPQ